MNVQKGHPIRILVILWRSGPTNECFKYKKVACLNVGHLWWFKSHLNVLSTGRSPCLNVGLLESWGPMSQWFMCKKGQYSWMLVMCDGVNPRLNVLSTKTSPFMFLLNGQTFTVNTSSNWECGPEDFVSLPKINNYRSLPLRLYNALNQQLYGSTPRTWERSGTVTLTLTTPAQWVVMATWHAVPLKASQLVMKASTNSRPLLLAT